MMTLGAQTRLDRMSPKRSDRDWVAARLADAKTGIMLMIDLKPAIVSSEAQRQAQLRWFKLAEIEALGLETKDALFLGLDHDSGAGFFALSIPESRIKDLPGGPTAVKPYVDLRTLAMQGALTPDELCIAGQARGLAQWHQTHRCCSQCGARSEVRDAGWKRSCWACAAEHFPRTDPVVIMLVTDGERCLLGHEKRFGQMYSRKFYSTLAGFLEPGEDIEAAVRREVREEVGLEVGTVHYHMSQPWPFPHSLMMGCIAEAKTTGIDIDKTEIEDARWFSRDDAMAALQGRHPELAVPGRHAIAHHLIKAFVEGSWGKRRG
jgi:NAD+ diphosphatase